MLVERERHENYWGCPPQDHSTPSTVLELIAIPPNYGQFCLTCAKPWPCGMGVQ